MPGRYLKIRTKFQVTKIAAIVESDALRMMKHATWPMQSPFAEETLMGAVGMIYQRK
jgi:hypothetical protein